MPVVIDEFEVINPPAEPSPATPERGEQTGADSRAAALQQALQRWIELDAERRWRLDDR